MTGRVKEEKLGLLPGGEAIWPSVENDRPIPKETQLSRPK